MSRVGFVRSRIALFWHIALSLTNHAGLWLFASFRHLGLSFGEKTLRWSRELRDQRQIAPNRSASAYFFSAPISSLNSVKVISRSSVPVVVPSVRSV